LQNVLSEVVLQLRTKDVRGDCDSVCYF